VVPLSLRGFLGCSEDVDPTRNQGYKQQGLCCDIFLVLQIYSRMLAMCCLWLEENCPQANGKSKKKALPLRGWLFRSDGNGQHLWSYFLKKKISI